MSSTTTNRLDDVGIESSNYETASRRVGADNGTSIGIYGANGKWQARVPGLGIDANGHANCESTLLRLDEAGDTLIKTKVKLKGVVARKFAVDALDSTWSASDLADYLRS